jgi:hypothetical protein
LSLTFAGYVLTLFTSVVRLSIGSIFDIVDQIQPTASVQECRNLPCCRLQAAQPLVNFLYMGSFLRFKK